MKSSHCLIVLVSLVLSGRCLSEQLNEHVTKEAAEKLGVSLTSTQGSDSVTVSIEFTPKDKLKNVLRIELEVGDPKNPDIHAPLQITPKKYGLVTASFSATFAKLPATTLTIVTHDGRLASFGYIFKVSDFVTAEKAEKKKTAANVEPVYKTAAEINAIPACKATVKRLNEYASLFTTPDGKQFTIGGETAEQEVWHFLGLFKDGDGCSLPAAFTAFSTRKCYNTAEAIKTIPACRATVKIQAPCYSVYTTTDGTVLVIGDPGSDKEVVGFLNSQEKGDTCQLPGAFLDYQKKK